MMHSPATHLTPIVLRSSHRLVLILIVAHMAVSSLLWLLPMPVWFGAVATILLLVSAIHSVRHYALRRGSDAVTTMAFDDRETIYAALGDGRPCRGRVLGSSTVGVTLTILNIALEGRRRPVHVVLLADSLDAHDFRRLRVWLRWGPQAATDETVV